MKVMGLLTKESNKTQEAYTAMAERKFSTRDFYAFVSGVFLTNEEREQLAEGQPHSEVISTRKNNILEKVLEYHETGPGQSEILGTGWGAYNAVTGYLRHEWKDGDDLFPGVSATATRMNEKAFALAVGKKSLPDLTPKVIWN